METVNFNVVYSGETGTTIQLGHAEKNNLFDSAVCFMPDDYNSNVENMGLENREVLDNFIENLEKDCTVQCYVYEYYEVFTYTEKPLNIGKVTVYYS